MTHVPSADWGLAQLRAAVTLRAADGDVDALEAAVREYLGVESVAFGNARTALWALLRVTAGLKRVWVPAYTCVAVPNAVEAAGLPIRWVDVAGPNLDMTAVLAEGRVGDAVIAQNTYGVPVDTEALLNARKRGVFVVEDRAHRFDAEEMAGDAAVFSLEHSKVVSGGQGGLAILSGDLGAEQLRAVRSGLHSISDAEARRVVLTSVSQLLFDWRLPIASAMGALARRVLLRVPATSARPQTVAELGGRGIHPVALHPRFARIAALGVMRSRANLSHRLAVGALYANRLQPLVPDWLPVDRPLVRFPVLTDDAADTWGRMRSAGIDLGPRWFDAPVHPRGSVSTYVAGSAPHAEELARRIVTLPTHPRISLSDAARIATVLSGITGSR